MEVTKNMRGNLKNSLWTCCHSFWIFSGVFISGQINVNAQTRCNFKMAAQISLLHSGKKLIMTVINS